MAEGVTVPGPYLFTSPLRYQKWKSGFRTKRWHCVVNIFDHIILSWCRHSKSQNTV